MIYATGTKMNERTFKMHAPFFPYESITFIDYTEKEMKQRYREKFGLKYKKIEWIILG